MNNTSNFNHFQNCETFSIAREYWSSNRIITDNSTSDSR